MELSETEPQIVVDPAQEHFAAQVIIDKDVVRIICSCGASTGEYETEAEARPEFDDHVKAVL